MTATPAVAALERRGIDHRLHRYQHDPGATSWGAEAAEALGVDADRVLKTLVVAVDDGLAFAVVAVSASLDLKALAGALGTKRVVMADPAAATSATGAALGAITAIGARKRLVTVVDRQALDHATVYCSAGRRGLEVELSPTDLVAVTDARVADIATPPTSVG